MDKDKLISLLQTLPKGTQVYVRSGSYGDDAWPAILRVFQENSGEIVAYIDTKSGDHRNFPEHYKGVKEILI